MHRYAVYKRNIIIRIFITLLQSFDVVAIQVTKVDFYDIIEVPGFTFYSIKVESLLTPVSS
jgi:hypothetical protein